mgnify:CR=1 FL=1
MFQEVIDRPLTIRPNPLSLTGLIAWLEQQPNNREYCYGQSGGCLLFQYFRASGFTCFNVSGDYFDHNSRGHLDFDRTSLPPHFNEIAIGHPQTFGGALKRARQHR